MHFGNVASATSSWNPGGTFNTSWGTRPAHPKLNLLSFWPGTMTFAGLAPGLLLVHSIHPDPWKPNHG